MKLLIIDDDLALSRLLAHFLEAQGHEVSQVQTAVTGLKQLETFRPEVVLLDHYLPDALGLELLPLVREKLPSASVLMITGQGSTRDAVTALKMGAENYLEKPFELEELGTLIEAIADKKAKPLKKKGQLSSSHADYLFLESPAMRELYERVREAASQAQVNVLIQGDTGTGKQHVARMLHDFSPRADGPFVELHCAALPETLIESELFGYEAGAFTGAVRPKPGLMEQSQGGTLFLDEIGELSLGTQAKLLKVLEERQLRRLGSLVPIRLDFRLVTASNRDLETELKLKKFRPDLYYRLNVLRLEIPQLKGRSGDIRALALHFFERFKRDFNKPELKLGQAELQRLQERPWPGNIRELSNFLERGVLRAQGTELSASDLGLDLLSLPPPPADLSHTDLASLRQAMEACRWNRSLAAQRLGISRPTLLKWLRRHELL